MTALLRQNGARNSYLSSNRSTPRSTPKNKKFNASNDKAVFLTGLKKCTGDEYDIFRNECYVDIQTYGPGNQKLYVKKFDYPKNANCAYLHLKTKSQAEHLKNIKTLTLAGHEVKVYEYNPSEKRQDEERIASQPKQLLDTTYDSGMNSENPTGCHTPLKVLSAVNSNEGSKRGSIALSQEIDPEMLGCIAPAVTRQVSTIDSGKTAEMTHLQDRLTEISTEQMKMIMNKLALPFPVMKHFPEAYAQLKVSACAGVMQELYTEEEYCERVTYIFNAIALPAQLLPDIHERMQAEAFVAIMTGALTVNEFNERFAACFYYKIQGIYNQMHHIASAQMGQMMTV